MDYTMITSDKEMSKFREYLKAEGVSTLAMDFEGEFNLHIYGEKLCLIQIFDGKKRFVIDPFNIGAEELSMLLEDGKIVKLIYDANSDSKTVYKQYGIKLQAVYDQKMLVDILALEKKGLDAVLEQLFGIVVKQKEKFQRYNWTRRPIDKAAIEYALADVEHLFALRTELERRIIEAGKLDELLRALVTRNIDYDKKSVPAIKKMPEYQRLNEAKKALFEKILEVREAAAKEANCPPNDILTKEQVFRLVADPASIGSLPLNARMPMKTKAALIESIRAIG